MTGVQTCALPISNPTWEDGRLILSTPDAIGKALDDYIKEREGIIQKVNEPKYSEKYGVWSISLKENGKWTSVWRKDQSKSDELYRLLVKRMKSNGLGIDLKPTTLSQKQLEISQLCFNRLEANQFLKMDDDSTATKMLSAVDFFKIGRASCRERV